VLEISKDTFEHELDAVKKSRKTTQDTDLDETALREVVERYKGVVKKKTGKPFPQNPSDQLKMARDAVFRSWMNPRAQEYRRIYDIPDHIGTAVNVQMMVFGNTGNRSGTGVGFTRNPATGKKEFYGEFLINAQGEDVVAGVRTPEPVAELKKQMPKAYGELERIRQTLEKHFKDVQDFEFTIENGVVYMLQTRNGKRTAMAALKFSIDMVKEKLIDWKTAVMRNPADQLEQLLAPVFDAAEVGKAQAIATGLPAGPGAASGQIYLNAERAVTAAEKGEKVLLVRVETSPEDLRGMIAAEGILTARGGVSSHAALVARQMGKVCVCGAAAIEVDYQARTVKVDGRSFKEGDWMSIDGTAGKVYAGQVKTAPSEIVAGLIHGDEAAKKTEKFRNFQQLMKWCSDASRMSVRTNADTPEQTENAVAFGAVGIGLTRTEHMFFEGDRIDAMREMILAETIEERKAALAKLLPYQREDFAGIFRALKGFPATIRFLDPPLHEFLPHTKEQQAELAKKIGVAAARIHQRVEQLHEFNPMLGFRGCRLGIGYPEISAMQARAVFEAAAQVQKEGIKVRPEVMIPLVGFKKELDLQIEVVHQAAREVQKEQGVKLNYMVGTMIEIPRGALTADEIAQSAEFFSFGTNDLTQTGLGMSRDDSGSFLPQYQELEIVKKNPFATIDTTGVGQLVEIAVTKGRATRPNIKLGICGEHGGDPASIHFFEQVGLDYVSCSPYRVPVARLAAAQAALQAKG
jgi:pyruvate,orthophosphate dikinase